MYGSRSARPRDSGAGSRDGGGDADLGSSRARQRAANERASPALYWLPDYALPGGAGAGTKEAQRGASQRGSATPRSGPHGGGWDVAGPGRPPRFTGQGGGVGATPRAQTPPGRLPPPQRVGPASARRQLPQDAGWYAQPPAPAAQRDGDDEREWDAQDGPSAEALSGAGDTRLGSLIADNLQLLRTLMAGGAASAGDRADGEVAAAMHASLVAALPRRAPRESWGGGRSGGARLSISSEAEQQQRWESPPGYAPPVRESYGGSAVGVTTVPWPPPAPPPRVSESFAGFLRPGPPAAPGPPRAPAIAEDGDAGAPAAAPDVLSAALQRRVQQQARELDEARRHAAQLEEALEAAHSQADQAIAATAATAAAAASAADAAMSSPALAALLQRVEAAESRAQRASEAAEARANEAEEFAMAAVARSEAAAEDADARIAAATSDAMRAQITQRHFDAATSAAAEAIAAAETRADQAEAALDAALAAAAAAESRARAAEAEIPDLRRAAAAAEQALAEDRVMSRRLATQLQALQAWSGETAAELRELRAAAARSLTPPPGAHGPLDGLLASAAEPWVRAAS